MKIRYNMWVYIEPVVFDGEDGEPDDNDIGLPEKVLEDGTQKDVMKLMYELGFSEEDMELKRTEMETYEKALEAL